jgi:Rhodopirellula transposase DDE domain
MSASAVHQCSCPTCRSSVPHPDQALHRQINLFVSRLDEQQRRWFAALEATRLGRGGAQRLAEITGINRHTILRGQRELAAGLVDCPSGHVRRSGAGRPTRDAQDPELKPALETLLAPETAGDPMGRRAKIKRSSLQHLSDALATAGHPASRPTVTRLVRELGYSPKANSRRGEARRSPWRNTQFEHIADQRAQFEATGEPIVSVDSKKKRVDR